VGRSARFPFWRIAERSEDDLCTQLGGALGGSVEVADLEPQQHTIARRKAGIADGTMFVVDLPVVELENELAVRDEPFVVGTAMRALTAEEPLVPRTARFDIVNRDKWLGPHASMLWSAARHAARPGYEGCASVPLNARTVAGGAVARNDSTIASITNVRDPGAAVVGPP
jgi:hypothetical protein